MHRKHGYGYTLLELIIVVVLIAVGIAVALPLLARPSTSAYALKDATQIKQIHEAWTIWSGSHDGVMPTPGLINRGPDPVTGASRIGIGPEDETKNTSRHLHSSMIMQNFYTPEICIGPTEPSPQIGTCDDYDWEVYHPDADIYWFGDHPTGEPPAVETGFRADIGPGGISHVAYFSPPLAGLRKKIAWRGHRDRTAPMLSNRAPYRGADESTDDYRRSWTLLLHGSKKRWMGNVVYADNHVDTIDTFHPLAAPYLDEAIGRQASDNIFDAEFSAGLAAGDAFLTMTRSVGGPSLMTDYRETLR
ncbi:MAG: type II secretion system protein [Planctomycetota bacterium]|jgi:prepilin-type N-terminal cleavage/methylation domain-containing protein